MNNHYFRYQISISILFGLFGCACLLLICVFAPLIATHNPLEMQTNQVLFKPSNGSNELRLITKEKNPDCYLSAVSLLTYDENNEAKKYHTKINVRKIALTNEFLVRFCIKKLYNQVLLEMMFEKGKNSPEAVNFTLWLNGVKVEDFTLKWEKEKISQAIFCSLNDFLPDSRGGGIIKVMHIMGTDDIGRDLFSREIYGTRSSLSIAFIVTIVSIALGLILGVIAGYFAGWIESLIGFLSFICASLPRFFLILIFVALWGNKFLYLIFILSVTGWVDSYTNIRTTIINLKGMEFVESARAIGASGFRIIFKELFPHLWRLLIVFGFYSVGYTIMLETSLSYLGFGFEEPFPSWGNILRIGLKNFINLNNYWMVLFPSLFIMVTVLFFLMTGEVLNRHFLKAREIKI